MKAASANHELSLLGRQAETVAETLSAMANANRLMILCHLSEGERTVNELTETVGLAQSAVSQHLGKMRALRLVKARRNGKRVYYSLASEAVQAIMKTLYAVYCAPAAAKNAR